LLAKCRLQVLVVVVFACLEAAATWLAAVAVLVALYALVLALVLVWISMNNPLSSLLDAAMC
jgi:hypothetical protein